MRSLSKTVPLPRLVSKEDKSTGMISAKFAYGQVRHRSPEAAGNVSQDRVVKSLEKSRSAPYIHHFTDKPLGKPETPYLSSFCGWNVVSKGIPVPVPPPPPKQTDLPPHPFLKTKKRELPEMRRDMRRGSTDERVMKPIALSGAQMKGKWEQLLKEAMHATEEGDFLELENVMQPWIDFVRTGKPDERAKVCPVKLLPKLSLITKGVQEARSFVTKCEHALNTCSVEELAFCVRLWSFQQPGPKFWTLPWLEKVKEELELVREQLSNVAETVTDVPLSKGVAELVSLMKQRKLHLGATKALMSQLKRKGSMSEDYMRALCRQNDSSKVFEVDLTEEQVASKDENARAVVRDLAQLDPLFLEDTEKLLEISSEAGDASTFDAIFRTVSAMRVSVKNLGFRAGNVDTEAFLSRLAKALDVHESRLTVLDSEILLSASLTGHTVSADELLAAVSNLLDEMRPSPPSSPKAKAGKEAAKAKEGSKAKTKPLERKATMVKSFFGCSCEENHRLGKTPTLCEFAVLGRVVDCAYSGTSEHEDRQAMEKIIRVVSGTSCEQSNKLQQFILHSAAMGAPLSPFPVEFLVKNGADPLYMDAQGNTALHHLAAGESQCNAFLSAKLVTVLASAAGSCERSLATKNKLGCTPLTWMLRSHCAQQKKVHPEALNLLKSQENEPDCHGLSSEMLRGSRCLCLRSHTDVDEREAILQNEPDTLFAGFGTLPEMPRMGMSVKESVDIARNTVIHEIARRLNEPSIWSQISKAVAECFEILSLDAVDSTPEVSFRAGRSRFFLHNLWIGALYPLLRTVSDFTASEYEAQAFEAWLKSTETDNEDLKLYEKAAMKLASLLKGPMSKEVFDPRAPYRLQLFHWLRKQQNWSADLLEEEYEKAMQQNEGQWLALYPDPQEREVFHQAKKSEMDKAAENHNSWRRVRLDISQDLENHNSWRVANDPVGPVAQPGWVSRECLLWAYRELAEKHGQTNKGFNIANFLGTISALPTQSALCVDGDESGMRTRLMLTHTDWLQATCDARQTQIKDRFETWAYEALGYDAYIGRSTDDRAQRMKFMARKNAKGLERTLEKISDILAQIRSQCDEELRNKYMDDLKTAANFITDINGVTIIVKNVADMRKICESLRAKTWRRDRVWVVSTYNTFHTTCSKEQYQKGGYRDLKMIVLVEIDSARVLVEVQVHLYTFYRLKDPQMHLTYEFVRGSMDWPSKATKGWYFQLLNIWNSFRQDGYALKRVQKSIEDLEGPTSDIVDHASWERRGSVSLDQEEGEEHGGNASKSPDKSKGRVTRAEFTILQEKWSWKDKEGKRCRLQPSQIQWLWELAIAGNDGGAENDGLEGASTYGKTKLYCPCPSVGTWLRLIEDPSPVTLPQRVEGAGCFDAITCKPNAGTFSRLPQTSNELRVNYRQFCSDLFGADLLYTNLDHLEDEEVAENREAWRQLEAVMYGSVAKELAARDEAKKKEVEEQREVARQLAAVKNESVAKDEAPRGEDEKKKESVRKKARNIFEDGFKNGQLEEVISRRSST